MAGVMAANDDSRRLSCFEEDTWVEMSDAVTCGRRHSKDGWTSRSLSFINILIAPSFLDQKSNGKLPQGNHGRTVHPPHSSMNGCHSGWPPGRDAIYLSVDSGLVLWRRGGRGPLRG